MIKFKNIISIVLLICGAVLVFLGGFYYGNAVSAEHADKKIEEIKVDNEKKYEELKTSIDDLNQVIKSANAADNVSPGMLESVISLSSDQPESVKKYIESTEGYLWLGFDDCHGFTISNSISSSLYSGISGYYWITGEGINLKSYDNEYYILLKRKDGAYEDELIFDYDSSIQPTDNKSNIFLKRGYKFKIFQVD
jgi:hypothetical protein